MARASAPSLRGIRKSTSPRGPGRDVVLPRTIDATLKHLSMLGIGENLGETMSGLALIVVPSLLKYHSGASEASEKRVHLHNIAGNGNQRTHCWYSWSREYGNSVPIEGDRVGVFLQLTQSFQCQTRRLTERLDRKLVSGCPLPKRIKKYSPSAPRKDTPSTGASSHHKCCASSCSCGTHVTAVNNVNGR